ncbi:hypothetical protein B0O99DRAFT_694748 [Bisporella sp. PMI_857]|nr:hypothetical protein B0O99DRAFT_694748 [Bisporella sp. PMI_857]
MSWTDGAVPNVIWLRIYSRGTIPVGAVRRDNHIHCLGCPLNLADEPALGRREGSRVAIALASLSAMLALAHRDKTRRPRSKRRFTEIDEPIITHPNEMESAITVNDDDDGRCHEPQLKRKRTQISAINHLLWETKTEIAKLNPPHHHSRGTERYRLMDDRSKELRKQLLRRCNCLGDARRYILDHETEAIASGYQHLPLSAVNSVITEK